MSSGEIAAQLHSGAGFAVSVIGAGLLQLTFFFPYDCEGGLNDTQFMADSCETIIGVGVSPELYSDAAGVKAVGLSFLIGGGLYILAALFEHLGRDRA